MVNYRVPDKQFSINFKCNGPPFRNAHSDDLFRKVTSYHMSGRYACNLLALEGYRLDTLAQETFKCFHKLERLELLACKVRLAQSDGFPNLPALQKLVIENSAFMEMNPDLFVDLVQLQELTVQHCTGIDFKVSALANIVLIEVKNSAVRSLPSMLDLLPATLKVIDFVNVSSQNGSELVLVASDKAQIAVQRITLIQCALNSVAVKNMPQLVSLNLSKNSLSERSVQLENLPALETLVLSNNVIDAVTQTLFLFRSSLDTIDLSHNRIAYLQPNAFGEAHSLRVVNLSYNLLLNLEGFDQHSRLDRIEMDSNPWDCTWLIHCRSSNPALFHVFRYTVRYDLLSLWGLPCLLQNSSTQPSIDHGQTEPTTPERSTSHPQVPVSDEAIALPMDNIYEEIRDETGSKRASYDALNFQHGVPEQRDDSVPSVHYMITYTALTLSTTRFRCTDLRGVDVIAVDEIAFLVRYGIVIDLLQRGLHRSIRSISSPSNERHHIGLLRINLEESFRHPHWSYLLTKHEWFA
uniref:Uncharacterized protein n=1 Tax=Anopheles minimus TaxID=112268 RepID=A0A182WLW2_9DIPT